MINPILTAEEAREITNKVLMRALSPLSEYIRDAAEQGETYVYLPREIGLNQIEREFLKKLGYTTHYVETSEEGEGYHETGEYDYYSCWAISWREDSFC